jgi:hypothetical protein
MSQSIVGICNLALSNVGVQQTIASLDEKSNEARACNRWYEQTRDEVLAAFPWPFATAYVALALVTKNPVTEWKFAYRYPPNCVTVRKILNPWGRLDIGVGFDPFVVTDQLQGASPIRIPFTLGVDAQGKLIYTDQEEANVEITSIVTNSGLFDPLFVNAFAWKLGWHIALGLTGGDKAKMVEYAEKKYMDVIIEATNAAANQMQKDKDPDSEFIRARS